MEFHHRRSHIPDHHLRLEGVGGGYRKGRYFGNRRPTEPTIQRIQDARVAINRKVQSQVLQRVFQEHCRCIEYPGSLMHHRSSHYDARSVSKRGLAH